MTDKKHWYDRYYKLILLIPILILAASSIYLVTFYLANGDFILKDTTISGGTTVTLTQQVDEAALIEDLGNQFPDLHTRSITDISSGEVIATLISSSAPPEELKPALEDFLGYVLTGENSSIEFTGSGLSSGFYSQLLIAILISFVLMSIVVFFLFKKILPSMTIIFAVFANIIFSITLSDLFGLRISAAGIAAFLMLIGYSVDTDILLTSRVLRRLNDPLNERIFGAFKTGIFMTSTALVALLPAFFIITGLPDSFKQIFLITAFGLFADIINTWFFNASVLKWWMEAKK